MDSKEIKDPPSLFIRAYSVAGSLMFTIEGLIYLFVGLIGYILFAVLVARYISPGDSEFYDFWLTFTLIVFTPFLVWYFSRAVKYYKRFKSWKQDYLEQSYILIFNTTIPKGNSIGERILNLSKNIFPELSPDYVESLPNYTDHLRYIIKKKWSKTEDNSIAKNMNYNINSYILDAAIRTERGYFIVKVFKDKIVTIDDIKQLIQIVTGKFKDKYGRHFIFRLICVAKKYEEQFNNRSSLEQLMVNEIKTKFPIDLIIEEDIGYSVLWIGR